MISNKKRAITQWSNLGVNFWPIYKCGTTTVLNHFQILSTGIQNINDEIKFKRSFAKQKVISPELALKNGLKNFTVVRNPWYRFCSMYKDMFIKRPKRGKKANISLDWSPIEFAQFLSNTSDADLDIHFKSQFIFVEPYVNDLEIIKLENINKWSLDIPAPQFNHHNTNHIDIEFNSDTKEIILNRYQKDFEFFNYFLTN